MNEKEYQMIDGNNRTEAAKEMIEHNPDLIEGTLSSQEITKPARGRPAKVDAQMFIETWEKADDLREVAALLGMPTTSASVRASNMRKSGVSLKQFRRGRKRKTA